ncbi:MAG: hypothetical protein DCC67_13505 [Planctomycetota bacterium]|nr:MAG: hypothetical protein DCC67_13505 [Planctomycetota bacterium]
MSFHNCHRLAVACLVAAMCTPMALRRAEAQDAAVPDAAAENAAPAAGRGWTLDQALAHLRLFPRDAYVQYVALQLAQREGLQEEVAAQLQGVRGLVNRRLGRRQDVDAFSIFSGSLAVQESLQLDEMLGDVSDEQQPRTNAGRRVGPRPVGAVDAAASAATVPLSEIERPLIKSHPWHEMLAGRRPDVSLLSRSVPDDFYLVEFRSVNKLLEAADVSDLWGRHVMNHSLRDAQTQLVNERLRRQLAVEDAPLLRPFYDKFVERVAVAGSDLFLREGSDVTLLFHVRQAQPFRLQMEQFLASAQQARPDAVRSTETYHGVEITHVATPDRQLFVFSADPTPALHVRTNSRSALHRVLDAIQGKTPSGQLVARLGETEEFQYIRTLMPLGAEEEDGFVYLSDPFIRKLVGPQLRLTEGRRLRCYNHLKMIGHAALMYRTEHGKAAATLAELASAGCAPGEFGKGRFACPQGGDYSLAADGLTGVCSHHGYASYLTPCCELELQRVTEAEAAAYRRFLAAYNQYWRTFFDPIAIRLTLTPTRYRAETIVLPLIDNSIYTNLAAAVSGAPEPLDSLPVPKRNIFSVALRLNKARLLGMAGMEELLEEPAEADAALAAAADASGAASSLRRIALAMHNYVVATTRFPAAATTDADGKPLLSWRVELLQYLDDDARQLYEEFRRDEPWDSEHNRKLIGRMPAVYRPANEQLAAAGKTRFVVPVGEDTAFPPAGAGIALKQITDGTTNTIALLEVEDDDAVIWTKPDDVAADAQTIRKLAIQPGKAFLVALCDGSVRHLAENISDAALAALYTKSGEETINWRPFDRTPRTRVGPFRGFSAEVAHRLQLGKFLAKGIGNQIAFHAYDSELLVGFNLSQVVGSAVGTFRGGGVDDEVLWLGMLVGALNSPVYVSIPVADRQVVDDFLARLDEVANEAAHQPLGGGFFELQNDFYKLDGEAPMRSYGLAFGPVKWRFFWQRIGDGLYIASKPEVLHDIAALSSSGDAADGRASENRDGARAHAAVRIRPQHWQRVLPDFRLGWAENNRQACLKNCGPLHSLARAVGDGDRSLPTDQLQQYAARLYDVHYFCPDGGQYAASPDGDVTCTVHGSAHEPRQAAAPAETSESARLMHELRAITVTLAFLEDGLHAIVDIERTPPPE